jgi:hypothetical protein
MRILPDFSPVRHNRAFGRLLVGDLLSTLGSAMTSFAVVLQIWDLSRSSLAVGLLGLTFVPALNAAHFGGSPQTLGLLNAAVGVGGLLSAVLSGPVGRVSRQGRGMLVGTMIWASGLPASA